MDHPCKIEMLGGLRVRLADGVITRFKTHKNGALLAYLAYHISRTHTRESLIETFWPEVDLTQGRPSLSVALSSLRHQLEPPGTPARSVLMTTNADVRLNPAACTSDVIEFESCLKAAKKVGPGLEEIEHLKLAAATYQGELLFGYYDDWCLIERDRLAGLYVQALRGLVRAMVRERDFRQAIPYAENAVSAAPHQEELCRDLMQLYAATGQPSLALQQFRSLEERLQRDLGEAPGASTRKLANEISDRMQQAAPVRPSAPPAAAVQPSPSPVRPTGVQTTLAIRCDELSEDQRVSLRQLARSHGGQDLPAKVGLWLAQFSRAADAAEFSHRACRTISAPEVGPPVEFCLALHTGDAGNDAERSQTVLRLGAMLNAAHFGQILCSEETAVFLRHSLEPGARLRDLGRWRLRDQDVPILLFEILRQDAPEGGYPPPKAARAYQPALPMQFSRFFGRQQELQQISKLLGAPVPARLVTLSGPGGVGKTRLAVEAGQQLAEVWEGAVCFVALASTQEPERIVEAILDGLKQPCYGGAAPMAQLCERLNAHPTLLILDNLEQLADGAAHVIASLLQQAPALSCLVTSRRLLNIAAEQELPVLPLPVPTGSPDPERQMLFESVCLFVDRAQIARPDFQITQKNAAAISELCVQLEGLPLALELAAARALVLTPTQMLAQLTDRFAFLSSRRRDVSERHRTLRGAIEWSYRLLDPELQQFFAALSVFQEGWTLDAAEAVCGNAETLDALCLLQECSLLRAEPSEDGAGLRFHMMQALQAFGDEQLEADMRELLREKHAAAFARYAHQAASYSAEESRADWLSRLETERPNLRAALNYLIHNERITEAAQMCAALTEFWERRGWIREGAAFVQRCLAAQQPVEDRVVMRRLLSSAGWFAYLEGRYTEALTWQQRNLAECKQANDSEGECIALNNLGLIAQVQGEDEEAWQHFEASLAIARAQGHRARQAARLSNLGLLAIPMGRHAEAQLALEEALLIYRSDGASYGIAACLCNLGKLAIHQGKFTEAHSLAAESMRLFQEAQDRSGVAYALANLGLAGTLSGDFEGSMTSLLPAFAICRDIGLHSLVPVLLETLACNSAALAEYHTAEFALCAAEQLRKELRNPRSTFESQTVDVVEEQLRSALPAGGRAANRPHIVAPTLTLTVDQILTRILEPPIGEHN